ncbi:uncharacterized protein LOC132787240 isoform X1 [Drosophila nasuta]|uniref:uncharacterized protein LOC132787240 isoform X1 n=1 Tax=Drosophila nasuta TaxID=42062 RepID=UPI00295E65C7|nr:uncharacterized protein LOC132787240 isoform X1 [Drosophila nasuta]
MDSKNVQHPLKNEQSLRTKRRHEMYGKLIDLYKRRECLWMENHKDFFNFALKEEMWEEIANAMVGPRHPYPNVDRWKRLIHTLSYRVKLEQLHEQEANYSNQFNELPPRLSYSNKLQFLFKHMFDRKDKELPESMSSIPVDKFEGVTQESLAAKCMRLGRDKLKSRISFSDKLKVLENLRNRRRRTFTLSPEAFARLKFTGKKCVHLKEG